jgi:hypothetical protein
MLTVAPIQHLDAWSGNSAARKNDVPREHTRAERFARTTHKTYKEPHRRENFYAAFLRLLLTRPARRFPAVLRACLERAFRDAPERPSLFKAFNVA